MSSSKALLHGDLLLEALTETAMEVQRARSVADVLKAACAGLERLGIDVALFNVEPTGYGVRYHSPRPHLEAWREALLPNRRETLHDGGPLQQVMTRDEPVLFLDLRKFLREWPPFAGRTNDVAALSKVGRVAAMVPLHVRRSQWGALMVMHDDLGQEDLASIRLFSLQLGSAIEVAEGFEVLERRNAEMELVRELAIAGPRADSQVLARRALETLCRTSDSDCASLHRYDQEQDEYVMVGEALGYEGPLVDHFRRFKLEPGHAAALSTQTFAADRMPVGSEQAKADGLKYIAIIPLFIEGKAVGMLVLARRHDEPYSDLEVRSAETLGVQMASQLERARLYDEASRLYADLKKSYDELAHTQQELVRHERLAALGELAAVMAHEVRNPLGVIFNSLTTLKRLLHPTGDSEMLLNMVGEEADRLNRIVGDLLDFVRPYELVKKPVAVETIISSAVDAATQAAVHPSVRVSTEFPRELPPFPLDAHLLKQALVNLIVNAAQAMPRGGTVKVRAHVEKVNDAAWLAIEVCDEGIGLTPRAAEKMFQPFFTTKATGTGLGLAVVKRIVDAHLGHVTARANEGGKGTTFTVRFPPTHETRSGALTPPRPSPAFRR